MKEHRPGRPCGCPNWLSDYNEVMTSFFGSLLLAKLLAVMKVCWEGEPQVTSPKASDLRCWGQKTFSTQKTDFLVLDRPRFNKKGPQINILNSKSWFLVLNQPKNQQQGPKISFFNSKRWFVDWAKKDQQKRSKIFSSWKSWQLPTMNHSSSWGPHK